MSQNQLLRTAFRVIGSLSSGQQVDADDARRLRAAAPELELSPDFVALYVICREMRKRERDKGAHARKLTANA